MSGEKKSTRAIDYPLLIFTIGITLFGAYMVLSATFYSNIFDASNNPLISFLNDFEKIAMGFGVMILLIFFDMKWIKKFAFFFMVISIFTLLVTLIKADDINGSSRWLNLGFVSFAPSELAKLTGILYFAKIFEKINKTNEHYQWAWINMIIFGGLTTGLIYVQPDLSSSLIYAMIIGSMILVAGAKWRHIILVVLISALLISAAVFGSDYRRSRIDSLGAENTVTEGGAAQANQSLMAIAEGQIFGVGPGEAYQTKNRHSQSESDFIFSTVAETTGFLGATVLITAYVFILWRLVKIVIYSSSTYGALVVTGIFSMIGLQAAVHLLVATKIFPVTGVTLPFVSSGGTSVMILLGAIGIALNLSSNPEGLG